MAVTDSYASPQQYREVVIKTDAGSDGAIEDDLRAVSRWLDRKLGRFFSKDAAAVARTYVAPRSWATPPTNWAESENPFRWGNYQRMLSVDDIAVTPTSIKIDEDGDGLFTDETALVATDYELWPLNADKGPEAWPWTAIVIPTWSSKGGFPAGKRVEVTAQFGWPAVPDGVMRATCHLTGILRLESPRATSRVNELDQVVGTSPAARQVLDDIVRQYGKTTSYI